VACRDYTGNNLTISGLHLRHILVSYSQLLARCVRAVRAVPIVTLGGGRDPNDQPQVSVPWCFFGLANYGSSPMARFLTLQKVGGLQSVRQRATAGHPDDAGDTPAQKLTPAQCSRPAPCLSCTHTGIWPHQNRCDSLEFCQSADSEK
jgi:hypothetical protein